MGELGASWTSGLQKGDGKDPNFVQVAVTLKHFDANSLEGGAPADEGRTRHTVDVNLTNYLLQDYYWPAFRKSIKDAGAKGVMCSYNSVNGIPTCLSPLMKAARDAWNFDGYGNIYIFIFFGFTPRICSRTLMGFGAPHQCSLGVVACYFYLC